MGRPVIAMHHAHSHFMPSFMFLLRDFYALTSHFSISSFFFFFFLFSFVFLGSHPQHTEIPRLGVQSELQLPAYTTATATQDPSHFCNLHHSSQQCQSLNPLCEARDQTCNLIVPRRIRFHCATVGTPIHILVVLCCPAQAPSILRSSYCGAHSSLYSLIHSQ